MRCERASAAIASVLALIWPWVVLAQDPTLETLASRILERHQRQRDFPGAVLAVDDPMDGSHVVAVGRQGTAADAPRVDPETPWIIGSATKTFVAVVVLQLANEGCVELDGRIRDRLPELPPALDRVTVRQLLQHTSGLPEYLDSSDVTEDAQRSWSPEELLGAALARGAVGEPGGSHHYANTNYLVLGMLIEACTGHPWYESIRQRILEPLEMKRSGYAGQPGALRVGRGFKKEKGRFVDATERWHPSVGGSAGGMYSTAEDLLRLARALRDDALQLVDVKSEMQDFVPAPAIGHVRHEYGLGLERYVLGDVVLIGHLGSGSAHSSFFGFDPTSRLAVAVVSNAEDPAPAALAAAELVGRWTRRSIEAPPAPSAAVGHTIYPFATLSGGEAGAPEEVRVAEWTASVSHTLSFNQARTHLSLGVDYQRLEFAYRGGSSRLDAVNSISATAFLTQQLNDRWGLLLVVAPGYADDFEGPASANAFNLTLIGAATYRVTDRLRLGLGLTSGNLLGELLPLPMASVDWEITPRISFEAIVPAHAWATYRPFERLALRLGLELGGNSYHGDPSRFGVDNPQLNYFSLRSVAGVRWYVLPWLHVTAHGGYTLLRRFEFSDGSTLAEDYTLHNGPVFGFAVGVGGDGSGRGSPGA